MTLAFVAAATTLLVLGGHAAATVAWDRTRSPGRTADRALVLLSGATLLAAMCAITAGLLATASWRFEAHSVRSALVAGDPVRLLSRGVPGPPGAEEWLAIVLLSTWVVVAGVLWLRDRWARKKLCGIIFAPSSPAAVDRFFALPAIGRALRHWQAESPKRISVVEIDPRFGPMTWGFRRPVIGIPSPSWDESVLVHELAHIIRGDAFRTVLLAHASRIGWFVPPVRRAAERIRLLVEVAVDDMVVRSGVDPLDYADALLRHARRPTPGTATGAFLADARAGSALGRRVSRLTGSRLPPLVHERSPRGSVALLLGGALLAAAAVDRSPPTVEGCAAGAGPVTTWRQLDPDRGGAKLRWWSEACQGSLRVRGPLLVTTEGQLVISTDSDAQFRLVLDSPQGRREFDLDREIRTGLAFTEHGVVVIEEPALREVVAFLFRETGWDGGAWTRHLARTGGVEGLLVQSRLAHDPLVKAHLVAAAIEEAGVAPFVELLREDSEAGTLQSLIGEVSGSDRRSEVRRAALEAALALR